MHQWIPVDSILLQALLKLYRFLPPHLLESCHFLQCICTVQHVQAHQGMATERHSEAVLPFSRITGPSLGDRYSRSAGACTALHPYTSSSLKNEEVK